MHILFGVDLNVDVWIVLKDNMQHIIPQVGKHTNIKPPVSAGIKRNDMNLTKEQIENWRKIMMMQGFGSFAMFCPEEVVITYARRIKEVLENSPEVKEARKQEQKPKPKPKKCPPHENVITGNNGKYCIDCESYL